jgi:hypothetical protein
MPLKADTGISWVTGSIAPLKTGRCRISTSEGSCTSRHVWPSGLAVSIARRVHRPIRPSAPVG